MFRKNKFLKNLKNISKMETILGSETFLKGVLSSEGAIRVDGKLEGDIGEATYLIVGEGGEICGNVQASQVVVGGKVTGNIEAHSSLELLETAQVLGDIKTASLSIADGSFFEGNCSMLKEKNVIEMELSSNSLTTLRS
ncbi:MAG: polymer-forming cytoskeletal protein [Elusimicrobia bacterium]|nr:polymer-forming cytoskeletal protein [Elusimicrobiota bacterium]